MVNRIMAPIAEALFPNYCYLCQWRCPGPLPLCQACRAELAANRASCQRCALPLATDAPLCGDCLTRPPAYNRVVAPWLYCEYLAYIIGRWKYNGDRTLTPLLADMWSRQVTPEEAPDILLPVPLHWRRQWQRGYNQAELLAMQIAREYSLKVNTRLLRRRQFTSPQSGMDARLRIRNVRDAFTVTGACDNLRVALVDDVLTTGATASELARILKQAGAAQVEVWCLARTPPPGYRIN